MFMEGGERPQDNAIDEARSRIAHGILNVAEIAAEIDPNRAMDMLERYVNRFDDAERAMIESGEIDLAKLVAIGCRTLVGLETLSN